ncbi:MAG: hypothetical protein IKI95_02000 [Clostridia bacterium]|nr:hypothetical protein [Clostridia bacterium]
MNEYGIKARTLKIKDNKIIILNKLNKKLLEKDYNATLFKDHDVETMIKKKMKLLKCSELEATEILRKEV